MAKKNRTAVSGNTVRSFAVAQGLPVKETRGRLPKAVIEAFETANPTQVYVPGTKDENKVTLTVAKALSNGKTRNQKVEVTVSEARALAGKGAGKRGILSEKAILAASEAYAKA